MRPDVRADSDSLPDAGVHDYVDKRLPCVEDLEDIAWLLRSKSAGKNAGFVSAMSNETEEAGAVEMEEPAAKR